MSIAETKAKVRTSEGPSPPLPKSLTRDATGSDQDEPKTIVQRADDASNSKKKRRRKSKKKAPADAPGDSHKQSSALALKKMEFLDAFPKKDEDILDLLTMGPAFVGPTKTMKAIGIFRDTWFPMPLHSVQGCHCKVMMTGLKLYLEMALPLVDGRRADYTGDWDLPRSRGMKLVLSFHSTRKRNPKLFGKMDASGKWKGNLDQQAMCYFVFICNIAATVTKIHVSYDTKTPSYAHWYRYFGESVSKRSAYEKFVTMCACNLIAHIQSYFEELDFELCEFEV